MSCEDKEKQTRRAHEALRWAQAVTPEIRPRVSLPLGRLLWLIMAAGMALLIYGCDTSEPSLGSRVDQGAEATAKPEHLSSRDGKLPVQPGAPAAMECGGRIGRAYCIYEVQREETAESIVAELGLEDGPLSAATRLVYSNQPDLVGETSAIPAGTSLRVPASGGLIYDVRPGDTVESIASAFGVATEDLLTGPDQGGAALAVGQELLIVGATRIELDSVALESRQVALPASLGLDWPVRGPISSAFGPNHPKGLDIAVPPGTPVEVVAAGDVVFAGGKSCCGYGLYVIVDHNNGFQSLYGHLARLAVATGDRVESNQAVGVSGSTGYSTGPHLHVELRREGAVVNPLQFLAPIEDLVFSADSNKPAVFPTLAVTPDRSPSRRPAPPSSRTVTPTKKTATPARPAPTSTPRPAVTPKSSPTSTRPSTAGASNTPVRKATPLPPPGIVRR